MESVQSDPSRRSPLPPASSDVVFDGNPVDLDRVLGYVNTQQVLYPDAFGDNDAVKSCYLALHFRGDALDWHSALISSANTAGYLHDYEGYISQLKVQFGYSLELNVAGASTELMALRQTGDYKDLREFLNHFRTLCQRTGIASDVSRLAILYPKLDPYYHGAIVTNGRCYTRFQDAANFLLGVYSHTPANGKDVSVQRSKARCKVCGKRGHTGSQCKSKN